MQLPQELTRVTTLSKVLSIVTFLIVPFIAFFSGVDYQKLVAPLGISETENLYSGYYSLSPTVIPSPIISPMVSSSPTPSSTKEYFEEKTAIPNQIRYTSPKLGISFLYLNSYANQTVATKTVGNKVYVNAGSTPAEQGQWVQVFKKDPTLTLQQAIQTDLLKNIPQADCFTKDAKTQYAKFTAVYDVVVISYPSGEDVASNSANQLKCPAIYSVTNGVSYFLMDKNHPDKYLFFSIGQYAISADQSKSWQETITFL